MPSRSVWESNSEARSMSSSGALLTTRLRTPSDTELTGARSFGGFRTSSGIDCRRAMRSSSLASTEDETRGLLVPDFVRAPNPRLQRTRQLTR